MGSVKKVLVTGGCGFIGSHMVDRLLADGHHVVVIDNLSTGNIRNLEAHSGAPLTVQTHSCASPPIQAHSSAPLLDVHIECITNFEKIEPLFKDVDCVFHIAALADIVPSIERPMHYHNSNVNGTISVLEACRKHGVKRVIYAASSSCYGIPDSYPTPETAEIRCQYPYAVTKYLGERYAMYWAQIYKMNITSMRFFNVYGPRSRTSGTYGAVFGVFLAQKLNNKAFTIVGDGKQTRDFTFVTDIVDACVTASNRDDIAGRIFNVGSGNTYSVNRLVELLGGDVVYIPKRPGEPDCTFADTTQINTVLGWKPKVSFESGVQAMLDNIDYWREAPLWEPDSIAEATKDWFKYLGKNE